jgi:hypothetical protein
MDYDSDLEYAMYGTDDQVMYDYDLEDDGEDPPTVYYEDPYEGLTGNPDGYTRWWNPSEFGPGLLGYIQGALATPGYQSELTATLNPYKYFCDDLGVEDDLYTHLMDTAGDGYFLQGIFTAGTTNTRNYYLRFPNAAGVKYGYAVCADWGEHEGTEPAPEFSHMTETPALSVAYNGDVYYVDGTENGGNFVADINVWSWDYQPSTVSIETNVHSAVVPFDTMAITGGDANYSTWHTEFAADSVGALEGNEFWVICEYEGFDYTSKGTEYSVPGTYPEAPLAAFFRYDLATLDEIPCDGPVITNLAPDQAPVQGTTAITVTGTGLLDGSLLAAWITNGGDQIDADSTVWVSDTEVTATFTIPDTATQDFWDFHMTHG